MLIRKDPLRDEALTTKLLRELTHLPLAISQAAAYINIKKVPIAKYLERLQHTEQDTIRLISKEFPDNTRYPGSKNAVATTWLVSFNQIRQSQKAATELLAFVSYIEPKGIPQSLLPSSKPEQQFEDAIDTLYAYAFLTRRGDSKVFDMHSLVHLATRIWVQNEVGTVTTIEKATRHLAMNFPRPLHENREQWRAYFPHAFRILQQEEEADTEERSDLSYRVGRCLIMDTRNSEAVRYLEQACQWRNRRLAEDHRSRLSSQHALAIAYQADGQAKKAVELLEYVVAIREKLNEDDPNLLASQHVLACAYRDDGQDKKAIKLLEHVVAIEETLSKDDPSRLASQHALALAYQDDEQVKKAVEMLEHVVAVEARTLNEDHSSRLTSQHALAIAYRVDGQVKKAVELLQHVVNIRARTLNEDHPDRLSSEHALTIMLQKTDLVGSSNDV